MHTKKKISLLHQRGTDFNVKAGTSLISSVPISPSKGRTDSSTKNMFRSGVSPKIDDTYVRGSGNTPAVRVGEADINEVIDDDDGDDGLDTARGKYTLKSIVSLLTTASMVARIDERQQAQDVANDLDSGEVDSDGDGDSKRNTGTSGRSEYLEDAYVSRVSKVNEKRRSQGEVVTNNTNISTTPRTQGFDLAVEPMEETCDYIGSLDNSKRRIMIERLMHHFKLSEDEKVIGDFPAFLMRDVLIQGQIFLTCMHVLFFAYLPNNSEEVQLSGNLNIRSRIRGSTRYWAVLRNQSLSLYSSPTDIYFPELVIDLKSTVSIAAIQDKRSGKHTESFKIKTKKRTFTFSADAEFVAKSWTNALKKQHFAAQNVDHDSVSLKIPLVNVTGVIREPVVDHASTVRINAVESSIGSIKMEFVFVFLDDSSVLLKQKVDAQLADLEMKNVPLLGRISSYEQMISPHSDTSSAVMNSEAVIDKSPKKLSHLHYHHILPRLHRPRALSSSNEKSGGLYSLKPKFPSRSGSRNANTDSSSDSLPSPVNDTVNDIVPGALVEDINMKSPSPPKKAITSIMTGGGGWSSFIAMNDSDTQSKKGNQHRYFAHGLWNNKPVHYPNLSISFDHQDICLASPDETEQANKRFREHFNLGIDANLVSAYFAHLNRNIPVYGKVYLSEDIMGFRSLLPGTHTKMNLPLIDVEECHKEQAFGFGYEGLTLVVRGDDDLCFEFSSAEARDDAESIISKRVKDLKSKKRDIRNLTTTNILEADPRSAKMKLVEDKINSDGIDAPLIVDKNPYYEQTLRSHGKKLKIGLLTIGSRGDVQPYIAFGKGLQKEGHEVIIITHGEFREFVESHGIGFDEIAGNPAELMSLMVEHESLTVGLVKDAATNFRSWIAELLDTAWEACERSGLEVLIESPSAMAGIHIAEALQIPYLRAFTMPWTRTRAYPHAFIVPDQPRGGNYNYMTHVLFENIFWKGISGQVNKWRAETLKLPKTSLELMQQNKVPFFYNVSPTIFPPAIDFCEWVKVTGYWFLDEKQNYTPSPDLQNFISRARRLNKKLVYIGFGSIVVSDAKQMTSAIIEAVLEADVYCILNKGWSDRLSPKSNQKEIEVPLPDSIYNAGSIPHDWLFPQMDAVVHHGGSGTTGASLKAGCPTVIKPFFGDQYFYASRIQDIGAGIALKKLTSKTLARVLREASYNERMKIKALEVRDRIAQEDGVKTAVSCLYTGLEYARSLVLAKAELKKDSKSRLTEVPFLSGSKMPDLNLEKTFASL